METIGSENSSSNNNIAKSNFNLSSRRTWVFKKLRVESVCLLMLLIAVVFVVLFHGGCLGLFKGFRIHGLGLGGLSSLSMVVLKTFAFVCASCRVLRFSP